MARKKLTILHSNDLHGDFLPEEKDGVIRGGLAYLSGYVKKVRREEKSVLYANAGDMFRGSVIDSEYLGVSTIALMNLLAPDVTTVGNHEVDYGLAHLLFLERCARFPIINANLFTTLNRSRLFSPYITLTVDGLQVMFIGILTEEVLASTRSEKVIGALIDVEAAALEEFRFRDRDIRDDQEILIAMQNYHYNNFTEFMGVPLEEVAANMKPRIIATSVNNLVEEYFSTHTGLDAHVEGRLVILD